MFTLKRMLAGALTASLLVPLSALALATDVGGSGNGQGNASVSVNANVSAGVGADAGGGADGSANAEANTGINAEGNANADLGNGSVTVSVGESEEPAAGEEAGASVEGDMFISIFPNINVSLPAVIKKIISGTTSAVSANARANAQASGSKAAVFILKGNAGISAGGGETTIIINLKDLTVSGKQPAKLFGLIPVKVTAEATVDENGQVDVTFPWFRFALTTNEEELEKKLQAKIDALLDTTVSADISADVNAEENAGANAALKNFIGATASGIFAEQGGAHLVATATLSSVNANGSTEFSAKLPPRSRLK